MQPEIKHRFLSEIQRLEEGQPPTEGGREAGRQCKCLRRRRGIFMAWPMEVLYQVGMRQAQKAERADKEGQGGQDRQGGGGEGGEPGSYRFKRIKEFVYDMQAVLGKGNFSTVYRGRNQETHEEVAIKVIKLKSLTFPKLEELLDQEIAITRVLDHPNSIRCHEVLKSVNHCYFITEICEEGTLQGVIRKRGGMREEEVWPYVRDIYQGLRYLGSRSIVHRDIKPANIFLKRGRAKLADFGFAVYSRQPFKDVNIGSPLYMSPEGYLEHVYGPKTDVWAFGVIVYEMLHGKAPLAHLDTPEQLKQQLRVQLTRDDLRADLSEGLREMIMRCLQVHEKQRISMQEIGSLPYMQENRNTQLIKEVKDNSNRVRRLSVPNTIQFLRTTKNLGEQARGGKENAKTSGKGNVSSSNKGKTRGTFMTTRELPLCRTMEKASSEEIEENTSIIVDCREQELVAGEVTFNQSIGLIHYCRVGFKLSQQLPPQLAAAVKSVVIRILEELKLRVEMNQVLYSEQENRDKKNNKLQMVVCEYLGKYGKEMQGQVGPVLLPHLEQQLGRHLQHCEIGIGAQPEKGGQGTGEPGEGADLPKAYLSMVFLSLSLRLGEAVACKSWGFFGSGGVIECCLQEGRVPSSAQGYRKLKQQYEFNWGRSDFAIPAQ